MQFIDLHSASNLVATTALYPDPDRPWLSVPNPSGTPVQPLLKNNDVPGYEKCMNKPLDFISAMQEKASALVQAQKPSSYYGKYGIPGKPRISLERICEKMGKTWNPKTKRCE